MDELVLQDDEALFFFGGHFRSGGNSAERRVARELHLRDVFIVRTKSRARLLI